MASPSNLFVGAHSSREQVGEGEFETRKPTQKGSPTWSSKAEALISAGAAQQSPIPRDGLTFAPIQPEGVPRSVSAIIGSPDPQEKLKKGESGYASSMSLVGNSAVKVELDQHDIFYSQFVIAISSPRTQKPGVVAHFLRNYTDFMSQLFATESVENEAQRKSIGALVRAFIALPKEEQGLSEVEREEFIYLLGLTPDDLQKAEDERFHFTQKDIEFLFLFRKYLSNPSKYAFGRVFEQLVRYKANLDGEKHLVCSLVSNVLLKYRGHYLHVHKIKGFRKTLLGNVIDPLATTHATEESTFEKTCACCSLPFKAHYIASDEFLDIDDTGIMKRCANYFFQVTDCSHQYDPICFFQLSQRVKPLNNGCASCQSSIKHLKLPVRETLRFAAQWDLSEVVSKLLERGVSKDDKEEAYRMAAFFGSNTSLGHLIRSILVPALQSIKDDA